MIQYACMYVCTHVCLYVCVYVCMYIVCVHVCMHGCIYMRECMRVSEQSHSATLKQSFIYRRCAIQSPIGPIANKSSSFTAVIPLNMHSFPSMSFSSID